MKVLNKIQASALGLVSMLVVALLMSVLTMTTLLAVATNKTITLVDSLISHVLGNAIGIVSDLSKLSAHVVHMGLSMSLSKLVDLAATQKVKKSKSFKSLQKTLKNLNKKVK